MAHRSHRSVAAILALSLTAILPSVALAQPGGGDEDALTLRLAVADDVDRPSDPYVRAFVDEVRTRSEGSLTVEPVWDAGRDTEPGFEQGVAHLLVDGEYDLALSAGRAWHDAGITSLLALQAPFLIADDELAVAVAASPVADDLLAGMADQGVVGLALWPEDLRHPVAFEPCIGPLVSADQLAGLTVRAIPSAITTDIIEALGATHTWVDGYEELVASCDIEAAESGLRQGQSLPGRPTFTTDVTFFPKYQVLAANGRAFEALSPERQALLREAALAVRDRALEEHPSDADAAAEWCAAGGRVVLAGADGVRAFERAVRPVYDQLADDPLVAAAIADIQSLKESTGSSTVVEPCGPLGGPTDTGTASPGVPVVPEGVWRTTVSPEDARAFGADPANAGTITLELRDGRWKITWGPDSPGGAGSCEGPFEPVGEALRLDTDGGDCITYWSDVLFTVEGDAMVARVLRTESPSDPIGNDRAIFESHPWTRIDGSGTAIVEPELPTPGVWRRVATVAELQAYVGADTARQLAGTISLTFDGERWSFGTCGGPYAILAGHVRLTYELDPGTCGTAPLDLIWKANGQDGAESSTAPGTGEIDQAIFTGTWTRVGDAPTR